MIMRFNKDKIKDCIAKMFYGKIPDPKEVCITEYRKGKYALAIDRHAFVDIDGGDLRRYL